MEHHCKCVPPSGITFSPWHSEYIQKYSDFSWQEGEDSSISTLSAAHGSRSCQSSCEDASSGCNLHSEIEIEEVEIKEEMPEFVDDHGTFTAPNGVDESGDPVTVKNEGANDCDSKSIFTPRADDYRARACESDSEDEREDPTTQLPMYVPYMPVCPLCSKTFKGGRKRLPDLFKHLKSIHKSQSRKFIKYILDEYSCERRYLSSLRRRLVNFPLP